MDYSQLPFFYGFMAWVVCHFLLRYAINTAYAAHILRRKEFLIKFIIAAALFMGITLCFILIEGMQGYYIVFLIAVAIAICTSVLCFEEHRERYYQKYAKKEKGNLPVNGNALLYGFLLGWSVLILTVVLIKFLA